MLVTLRGGQTLQHIQQNDFSPKKRLLHVRYPSEIEIKIASCIVVDVQ